MKYIIYIILALILISSVFATEVERNNTINNTELWEAIYDPEPRMRPAFDSDDVVKSIFDPEARARLFKEGAFVLGIIVFLLIVTIYLSVESKKHIESKKEKIRVLCDKISKNIKEIKRLTKN